MNSGTLRLSVVLTVLVGTVLSVLPVGPAQAQWVMLARRAIGRIHHMAEANQQGGRTGYDFA
ncbi:MAG: hypothetical protein AB7U95_07795, partial [Reyranella sp.]